MDIGGLERFGCLGTFDIRYSCLNAHREWEGN